MSLTRPVVYALPRGGIPVGFEIAQALGAPLEVVLVRKIGAPGAPELALGAVVDGGSPHTIVNQEVFRATGSDTAYLERARRQELAEIERRRALYVPGRKPLPPEGRTAIVVDDGLATGATAMAAIRALKSGGASRVVLAIPVAPEERLDAFRAEAEVVCLLAARRFHGVGAFYQDFHQLTDRETLDLLDRAKARQAEAQP
jgi:predicted phosphoribosyltransferase